MPITFPQDLHLLKRSRFQHSNPVCDPVTVKVKANPDPADTGGFQCYISHKQASGRVEKSSASEPNAPSAAGCATEIADLCQCWVSRGRGVNFFWLFRARATVVGALFRKSWICVPPILLLILYNVYLLFIYAPADELFLSFSLEPEHAHAVSHLSSCGTAKG